jgi:predicted acetyltransferase
VLENRVKHKHIEEWLLRITDVDAALQQRGYANGHVELHFDVVDRAMPENAGRRVLTVRGGKPAVHNGGSGRIKCDVRGLTALFTGHATAEELAAVGLVSGPADDLAAAASVQGGGQQDDGPTACRHDVHNQRAGPESCYC